ncbi:RNA-binding protein [Clostridia bacterium]|nr:RNA-binding protein [Clostridia bacterium]
MPDSLTLTSKQRSLLRAFANTLDPVLHIGKDGLTDPLIKQAWDALEARECIKVTLQRGSPFASARDACSSLCERVHAQPVQVIGAKFVLYRPSREKPELLRHLERNSP